MKCTKESVEKIESRGAVDGKCAVCGEQVLVEAGYRSIWWDGLDGGGDVENVGEVYCPKCDGIPVVPLMGTPIYESETIEAHVIEIEF